MPSWSPSARPCANAATRWQRPSARRCPAGASGSRPAGLSLWIELDAPRSSALAAAASQHGLRLAAGPRFGVDGAFERFLRIPYTLAEAELAEAVERIAVAWRTVAADGARPAAASPALVA